MLPDPGGRTPAPEPLRMVQAFVNTLDIENGREELVTPSDVCDLLVRIGALAGDVGPLGDADVRQALDVREALRTLLLENNGGPRDLEAHATLERAARAAHLSLTFTPDDRLELAPSAAGLDGALGRVLAVAYAAMAAGTWPRLKACRRDVCFWVFYDRSKNLSSKWCAMSVCGNRTKKARISGRRS
jgi:predicted RNA-binding Zn ribbon-like protein